MYGTIACIALPIQHTHKTSSRDQPRPQRHSSPRSIACKLRRGIPHSRPVSLRRARQSYHSISTSELGPSTNTRRVPCTTRYIRNHRSSEPHSAIRRLVHELQRRFRSIVLTQIVFEVHAASNSPILVSIS
jgi:hypothetical protein